MSAYIGHINLVKSGTVTVTSEATGFEKENAQSWKTSSWWKAIAAGTVYFYIDMGAAVDVDCWGITGHNLTANAGTIKPEYSATGAWAGEGPDFDSIQTPDNNQAIFHKVTSRNARYFRFEIASTGAASFIANLFLGEALQLEREMPLGFSPANLNRDRKVFNNMSVNGQYLGRTLRSKGAKVVIDQKLVSRGWVDTNWEAFANHIELYPFYFAWDTANYPEEVAYCMANKIAYPRYVQALHLNFRIDCVAMYDV